MFDKGMKNYEKEIDIIELIRSFREIRIVLREYIMRERQNFHIEKTSELGFLNSVIGESEDEGGFSPTSAFSKKMKIKEKSEHLMTPMQEEESIHIQL